MLAWWEDFLCFSNILWPMNHGQPITYLLATAPKLKPHQNQRRGRHCLFTAEQRGAHQDNGGRASLNGTGGGGTHQIWTQPGPGRKPRRVLGPKGICPRTKAHMCHCGEGSRTHSPGLITTELLPALTSLVIRLPSPEIRSNKSEGERMARDWQIRRSKSDKGQQGQIFKKQ